MKKFVLVVISLVLLYSIAYGAIYPTTVIVCEVDEENDLLYCEDYLGNIWVIEGIEDYDIDDLLAMIMYDNETETPEDDIIIDYNYSGYAKGI